MSAETARLAQPFSNHTDYELWTARNCSRCSSRGVCGLEFALEIAEVTSTIPVKLALAYGATHDEEDPEFIELPTRCNRFAARITTYQTRT